MKLMPEEISRGKKESDWGVPITIYYGTLNLIPNFIETCDVNGCGFRVIIEEEIKNETNA